ncbi:hypothetical protein EI067_11665 [Mycobacterium paragordonae]|nr:hypothetical protein EI067_11665 [Mycobacterium paragordonae]
MLYVLRRRFSLERLGGRRERFCGRDSFGGGDRLGGGGLEPGIVGLRLSRRLLDITHQVCRQPLCRHRLVGVLLACQRLEFVRWFRGQSIRNFCVPCVVGDEVNLRFLRGGRGLRPLGGHLLKQGRGSQLDVVEFTGFRLLRRRFRIDVDGFDRLGFRRRRWLPLRFGSDRRGLRLHRHRLRLESPILLRRNLNHRFGFR